MRVVWTREVRTQLHDSWLFLADLSVAYADRVVARIRQRGDSLGDMPFQGVATNELGFRRLSIPDIQYVIVYRVDDDAIRILRLWNTAQDKSE